jgi:hypothetical protein
LQAAQIEELSRISLFQYEMSLKEVALSNMK